LTQEDIELYEESKKEDERLRERKNKNLKEGGYISGGDEIVLKIKIYF